MRIGVFPRLSNDVEKDVKSFNGTKPGKFLAKYLFDSVGRRIRLGDHDIGTISQTRVELHTEPGWTTLHPGEDEAGAPQVWRVYQVVNVDSSMEALVRDMLSGTGVVEFDSDGKVIRNDVPADPRQGP